MSAKASGADPRPNGDAKNRQHHDGSAGRAFTVEQKAAVIRIKRCSPTAFYEILGLEEVKSSCSEGDIKKAYRKLSLLTHPDKNGYDGADDAFKMVSRAFQILSDPDKKAKFDRFGGDPDARFPGASSAGASPFSNFGRSSGAQRQGPMWEEEISPEEMFRQFFGGGMGGGFGGPVPGGGIFDTGPGFVFNLGGGPGIRVHQFGGGRPRRRPDTAQPPGSEPQPSLSSALSSLLPLLFLFILPLLSSVFSGNTSSPAASIVFEGPKPPATYHRTSLRLKIPYWVNPIDVEDYSAKKWRRLDEMAETKYVHSLTVQCEYEHQQQARLMQQARGWLSDDEDKLRAARQMEKKNCKRLKELGVY
ncbi:DnaJ-domain-containing protein [Lindgomyces ingoldianus]|uniref:DnaJ-domain-containing protein n=1 Tax=Lindgomyces ingoldianus TaxID=673940 RepID=A0ACB6QX55_9PLEO|nr:DnaJ-domain-containing protein [Lindgomyces ingoldianus]KAF2471603.1 DnaJ-domain-containing protein [Lindgomyces ingoldianus]